LRAWNFEIGAVESVPWMISAQAWADHTTALGREVKATRAAEARADGEARMTAR
jgi:hypothetical protein